MCDSLGIEPKPNNGTLRLPLKPIGLHSDENTSEDIDLPDLPAESDGTSVSGTKAADPAETNTITVTEPPKGTLQAKQIDVESQTDSSQTRKNQTRPRTK